MSAADSVPRAAIVGCAGWVLTPAEAAAFAAANPLGFILFRRNCRDRRQLAALTAALRRAVGRDDAPILIDQEGGRVARLGAPEWWQPPAARAIAAVGAGAASLAWAAGRLIAADLGAAGITADCAPCLDLAWPGSSDVIGDRAFGADPGVVARLGRAFAEGLRAGGVQPIIKHVPGHGRAEVDSHTALPRVAVPRSELAVTDFAPFAALADQGWAMTAHVVYAAIDVDQPATLSPRVVAEVIRGQIGFAGVLVSDDIGMGALTGGVGERAQAAIAAGCDVVLECSGILDNALTAIAGAGPLTTAARGRLERARRAVGAADAADLARLRRDVDEACAGTAA
ncbi:MAG: beta-N-acetylhexosaminidase [Alphaproteobacteria bacterium]|nr:beta-N-acetylhexosaminidase [Alphaproteobacteria bacterium]